MKPEVARQAEQRLRRALVHEAEHWALREPPALKEACRAPRQVKAPARHRHPLLWAGTAAAAALLVLSVVRMIHKAPSLPDGQFRPAVVSNTIDREALYAALPKIPAPVRPPVPVRLSADQVTVIRQ